MIRHYTLVGLLLVVGNSITTILTQPDNVSRPILNADPEVKNLYKCKCEVNQVLVGDECQDEKTIVIAQSESLPQQIQIRTDELGNVTVRDINCSSSSSVLRVVPNSLFLSNGSLYDSEYVRSYEPEYFCFEHIKNNSSTIVNSKVCRSIPSVSQCCKNGFLLDSNSECYIEDRFSFSPPFKNDQRWEKVSGEVSMIRNCPSGYDLLEANVSDPHSPVYLILSENNEAMLHIDTFGFEVELNMDFTQYCVAASKNQYGFYYQASYCKRNSTSYHDEMCKGVSCSRKCCPLNSIFSMNQYQCVRNNPDVVTVPRIMTRSGFNPDTFQDKESIHKIVTGPPICSTSVTKYKEEGPVTLHGSGLLEVRSIFKVFTPTEYCIETLEYEDGTEETIFICSESLTDHDCGWSYVLISSLLAISSLFLFLTFISYLSLKELRGRISGKCLMSEVLSLLIAYIVLIVLQTRGHKLPQVNCQITGIIEYIFSLASFFWLNVMCLDMWITIRSHRPVNESSRIRFVLYSAYGWGAPFLLGVVSIVVDALSPDGIIRPGFGIKSCYFSDNVSKWAYKYSIILVLLLINLGLFIHIVIILMKAQKENEKVFTNQNRSVGGNRDASKERFWMYAKLFIVMGISWFAEVISSKFETSYPNSCYFWLPTDIINALRGVLIFIIFVCKKTTMKKLYTKWYGDFAPSKRLLSLKSQEVDTNTRSSNLPSESFPDSRGKSVLSYTYQKNRMDSLSLSDIPEDPKPPQEEEGKEETQQDQELLREKP